VASDRVTEASTSELKSAVFVSIRILYCSVFVGVTRNLNRSVSIRREVTSDLSRAPNALGASEWRVTGKFESDTGELK
jgi:hypothetical protein